ncbi:MAG TPA: DUF885 domain-containing protein [Pyrinomonadaceae bacterium]|jgi:hypothetical protein|nr:DUF885 domain-containing protein [Pyrinomonadaceae bacterium]
MRLKTGFVFFLIVTILFSGCQQKPTVSNQVANSNTNSTAANAQWDTYVAKFLDDYFAANPSFAVSSGKHDQDGKLPDWSEEGLKKEIDRLKAERDKAAAFKDEQLDERQRFERDYLIAQIDKDLFWRETADQPHKNPTFYSDALDPDVYVSRDYAPLDVRIKAYTAYAKNVPAALEQVKKNLKFPMAPTLLKIGKTTIGGLADFYEKDVPKVFETVKDEQSQKDFTEANEAAAKAIKDFDKWLGEQEASKSGGFELGDKLFTWMLKATEGVEIDLPKLEEIARQDLKKNLDALKVECDKYAPGKSLKECSEKASASKAEGTNVVDMATKQLDSLRKFITDNDLVSMPGTEQAKVGLAPPYKAWNFAYINIPGPYETGLSSTYYVAPPNPTWPKKKQEAYLPGKGSLLFTSVHEVYPGHFVQFLHANRSQSKFGQVFVGYAYAEGWAHYTEEMMYDAGLGKDDPEMHIGQLQEALLRNIRFLSAIGLHTKGMTVEESKKMFVEEGMQDEGSAEQQAERGTFDPAYLNYTMGKLMIRKLRDDWCASRGGRSAWKQFHDQFLSYGGPPIPLVRKAMMGKDDKGSLF